eukprot:TRINITY_DN73302_c0_g1_i1.p1 TRINITY_DN73302_c0_g1~~TRINITY_DN73302_c0_g1_i1.p1  ORF type:complete len:547 (-),score=90.13 TRINITY_DN73302_c0_g1_i1:309-1907(-)
MCPHPASPADVESGAGASPWRAGDAVSGLRLRVTGKQQFPGKTLLDGFCRVGSALREAKLVLRGDLAQRGVHRGDVVEVSEGHVEGFFSKETGRPDIAVTALMVPEPWFESHFLAKPCDNRMKWPMFHPLQLPLALTPGVRPCGEGGDLEDKSQPWVAVQCLSECTERLIALLKFHYGVPEVHCAAQFSVDSLVFLPLFGHGFSRFLSLSGEPDEPLPSFLHSVIRRVYYLTEAPYLAFSELLAALAALERPADEKVGVLAFPRHLETRLCAELDLCVGGPRRCHCVVYAEGRYFLGRHVPMQRVPGRISSNVLPSSAYWKLNEIDVRFGNCFFRAGENTQDTGHRRMALDIGASPGGWSKCLVEDFGMDQVFGVDPGLLHESVLANPSIEHWCMLGDAALSRLASEHMGGGRFPLSVCIGDKRDASIDTFLFSTLVCDANCEPELTVDMFEKAMPLMDTSSSRFLAVLTFKIGVSATAFAKRKASLLERIRVFVAPHGLQVAEIHLFANTKHETTVVIHHSSVKPQFSLAL